MGYNAQRNELLSTTVYCPVAYSKTSNTMFLHPNFNEGSKNNFSQQTNFAALGGTGCWSAISILLRTYSNSSHQGCPTTTAVLGKHQVKLEENNKTVSTTNIFNRFAHFHQTGTALITVKACKQAASSSCMYPFLE